MIDLNFIRENPGKVQKAARDKGIENINIDRIIELDKKRREIIIATQKLLEERNRMDPEAIRKALEYSKQEKKVTPEIIKRALEIKEEIKKQEEEKPTDERELNTLLLSIPNIPKGDVKIGKDETENDIVRKYKEPTEFDFAPKDHLELGELLDIIDVKNAAKVSGTRFAYLKNEGALLEFALVQLALDVLTKEGFIPIIPPVFLKRSIAIGLGYFQGKDNDQYYWVSDPDLKNSNPEDHPGYYLAGTAEHSIVPLHKDEVLEKKDLPKKYVGFSSAFRREAGTYGKDTRGILRVHQFDKVEMVSFTTEENSDKEQDYLLSLEEKLFQLLEIPYQVIKMCTGDLGFPVARKYDIEAWMPGQKKYREVTSTSTTTDFQSRRLNIKYNNGEEKKFVHILNGTAFAIGRTIIAILENYQQKDKSVLIPKILQKYLNKEKISPK